MYRTAEQQSMEGFKHKQETEHACMATSSSTQGEQR